VEVPTHRWRAAFRPSGALFPKSAANPLADPVHVPGYFKVRSRFIDFAGYYVLHSAPELKPAG
jgi:hypothetical protein